jgi:hypothetical protein
MSEVITIRIYTRDDRKAEEEFFKRQWAAFLQANYRTQATVMNAFGVSATCAFNWLNGLAVPSGMAVSKVYREHPAEAARYLDAA